MAGRNAKPIENCVGHRTKAEIETRESAQSELASGIELRESAEVRKNPDAHKLFVKLRRNYKAIGKNDALFEQVVNRYCLISAEAAALAKLYEGILADIDELQEKRETDGMDFDKYMERKGELYGHLNGVEKRLSKKRDMLFAIEKENLMTMQGVLRAIPKKPPAEESDPLADLFKRREERGNVWPFPT